MATPNLVLYNKRRSQAYLKKSVFKIIKLYNILKGVRFFNLQFINKIKNKGTNKAFKKS